MINLWFNRVMNMLLEYDLICNLEVTHFNQSLEKIICSLTKSNNDLI